ncbi:Transcriptional regulator, wHTH [Saccharolobus shibatae B12]|uniref:Transcriptional regulator, wHTH n=1 Tax=Saccharolobus shibatae (strain ATCC 51178 / DSM 5389 / JCM 8931 / NBRC 15437 / B12) TaxID=523848 RepID=A0A8F5BKL4_SACSH|nr:MarR family winged helix-turn-helix transcriptional regulator [Saccharolobus shibatae]QXJ27112.1 Transcriptional regulator, wHTH [Saccharolobus shibatae B12]QXJ30005.1 Transcriptional regulator, wHTH [Saccharolobus shibatae B12]
MKSEFLTAHAKVLLAIYNNQGCTVKEALEKSSLAPNTFYKTKEQLLEDLLIEEKEEQKNRTRIKKLYLTEKGLIITKALQCVIDALNKMKT